MADKYFISFSLWNLLLLHLMVLVFLELLFLLISTFIFFLVIQHLVCLFDSWIPYTFEEYFLFLEIL